MHRICLILLLSLSFLGCTVGPRYKCPEPCLPCEWQAPPSEGMNFNSPECFLWWESLNDPLLNSLIQRASRQNLDLHIAAMRILEARAARLGKYADLLPHIDASASAGHVYLSKNALVNGLLSNVLPPNASVKRNVNFFELGFDADWEIDLFGRTAHEIKAAQAQVQSTEESLYDLWITLSAEIARNYIEVRGLQQRLVILQQTIESQLDTLHLMKELLCIGKANDIDVRNAEEQLCLAEAQAPLLQLSINKGIHRLSILLGYSPGSLSAELCECTTLPYVPCDKPIGVPSELLRRRPDIRKAERDLAAATERIGSAVASLFPRISLQGFIGTISTQLHSLLTTGGFTWFGAPQILMPIFNSRLIEEDVNLNKIKTREALFQYQKTVLEALEETENAIASFHSEQQRNSCLCKVLCINQENYQLTLELYDNGFRDYIDVQTANRLLLSAEDNYLQSQMVLLFDYIALYKALGGGWQRTPYCP